jgi:hypothetical protein
LALESIDILAQFLWLSTWAYPSVQHAKGASFFMVHLNT